MYRTFTLAYLHEYLNEEYVAVDIFNLTPKSGHCSRSVGGHIFYLTDNYYNVGLDHVPRNDHYRHSMCV